MTNIEAQELWCHNCRKYVQFDLDLSLNGNHVLECPNCKHEHCRVVKDGVITGDRWDSRNGPRISVYSSSFTTYSTYQTYTSSSSYVATIFTYQSWMNTGR